MVRRGEVLMFSRIPIFLCHNNNKAIWLFLLEWAASSASASHQHTRHHLTSPPAIKMEHFLLQCQSLGTTLGKADIDPVLPSDFEPHCYYQDNWGRPWQTAEITMRMITVFPRGVTGPVLFSGVMRRDLLSISTIITMTCLSLSYHNQTLCPTTLQSIRKICLDIYII